MKTKIHDPELPDAEALYRLFVTDALYGICAFLGVPLRERYAEALDELQSGDPGEGPGIPEATDALDALRSAPDIPEAKDALRRSDPGIPEALDALRQTAPGERPNIPTPSASLDTAEARLKDMGIEVR